jgi:hypothetical protein
MITIQQTPDLVALAGSRQAWRMHTNKLFSNAGTVSVREMTLTAYTSAGQKFKLAWGNQEIEFVCAASPDDSGRQFAAVSSGGFGAVATSIFAALATNYYVTKDFVVTNPSAGKVRIEARQPGTAWSLTITNGSPGITFTQTGQAGVNPVANPNFRIVLQVMLAGNQLAEESLTSFANSIAEADVAELLLPEFDMQFDFPETSSAIKLRSGMCLAYFLRYAEAFGDPLAVFKLAESPARYLLNGGLSREMEALYNQTPAQWWADWALSKRFLTLAPIRKRVGPLATEKLYFLNVFKYQELRLRKKLVNFDLSENDTTVDSLTITDGVRVYEINCSMSALMPLSHQEDVKEIHVWLEDENGDTITEVRQFIIDQRAQAQSRSFIFLNSLGAYETLHCTGEFDTAARLETTEAERILPQGFTRRQRETLGYNINEVLKVKANSGYQFTQAHQDWLRDFLLSREVFEIAGTRLLPVNIDADEHHIRRDNEGLLSLEFTYSPAYRNQFYGLDPGSKILQFNIDVNAYTGGTRECLDYIETDGQSDLEVAVVIAGMLHHYLLRTGTEATSIPDIVRPTDYADRDNEQVWELQNSIT